MVSSNRFPGFWPLRLFVFFTGALALSMTPALAQPVPPTCHISIAPGFSATGNTSAVTLVVQFSQPIKGLSAGDFDVTNGRSRDLLADPGQGSLPMFFTIKIDPKFPTGQTAVTTTVRLPDGRYTAIQTGLPGLGCGPITLGFIAGGAATATPTATASPTPTKTPTPGATATFTFTPTPTRTPTATATPTYTATFTSTATPTPTSGGSQSGQPTCQLSFIEGSITVTTPPTAKVSAIFSMPVKGLSAGDFETVNGKAIELLADAGQGSNPSRFTLKVEAKIPAGQTGVTTSVRLPDGRYTSMANVPGLGCGPIFIVFGSGTAPTATPTPTPTSTFTPTATATPAVTATPTATETPDDPPSEGPECDEDAPLAESPLALPLFPNAQGYGTTSFAGSGRQYVFPCAKIIKVTNLNDHGPGTLRACVNAEHPRTCIFDVSGVIWANFDLRVRNPYVTIAGQTAPEPGITLRGASLSIETNDVLVQHVKFRPGDDPRAPCCRLHECAPEVAQFCTSDPEGRDGVKIWSTAGAAENIVLDHLSVAWALDEALSIVPDTGEISNVTISNSFLNSGLDQSIRPGTAGHSKGVLINGPKPARNISFFRNLLAHNADRNIKIATPVRLEYINNLVYDWGRGTGVGRTLNMENSLFSTHQIDVIGNHYLPGLDTFCPETQYQAYKCFLEGQDGIDTPQERSVLHYVLQVSTGLSPLSRYFLHDNIAPTRADGAGDEWRIAHASLFLNQLLNLLLFPENRADQPVASSGTVSVLSLSEMYSQILNFSGARPKSRDSVDATAVAEVETRTGRIINCVAHDGSERCSKNAGGWPADQGQTRELTIPDQPFADSDNDGYTNFDEWLFEFGAQVEQ